MDDASKFFKEHKIVPDMLSSSPTQLLTVSYGSLKIEPGVELTPTQVKSQPSVEWESDGETFYTLMMTDPDAPSRAQPKFREYQHWLVGNIPGNDVGKGEVLTAYVGSSPPKGCGLHRYVFLVYRQPGKIKFTDPHIANNSRENRPSFSASKFAKKYKLEGPIAGNFYQAQWDEYVPTVHKQLSGK